MGKFDFVAIDFETANPNFSSACSIGIAAVKNNIIVDEFYSLIKPPTLDFNPFSVEVHGIAAEDVQASPTFDELWPDISKYFEDNLIVAFNAPFDINVLRNCLDKYNIVVPSSPYICAMQLATSIIGDHSKNASLGESCDFFGIDLNNHHNAANDASACANIVIKSNEFLNSLRLDRRIELFNSLTLKNLNQVKPKKDKDYSYVAKKFKKVNTKDIVTSNTEFDTSHVFYQKNFVFTGNLLTIDKKEAMQKVVDLGGTLKSGVSKLVHYVVVGVQDLSIVGPDGKSSKERKALELLKQGHEIKILSEEEFLSMF